MKKTVTRKSISTYVDDRIRPLLKGFVPEPVSCSGYVLTPLEEDLSVLVVLHWTLKDIDAGLLLNLKPYTSPIMIFSPFDSPPEEQLDAKQEGQQEEDHVFANIAMDMANRLKPFLEEAGLNTARLSEYNPTFDFSDYIQIERYAGFRVVMQGRITRTQLGLLSVEEEIGKLVEPTKKRWECFIQRHKRKHLQSKDVDLGRFVASGYQGEYGKRPIYIETGRRNDGSTWIDNYGLVNPCYFGDQAGGHACYCSHNNGPRKCHYSSYTGGIESDQTCPMFAANPLWQEVTDDFYENRSITIKVARHLGLVEEDGSVD